MLTIVENPSLRSMNTFGIDVSARYLVSLGSAGDVSECLENGILADRPRLVLGDGSNVVLTGDFPGVVLRPDFSGIEVAGVDGAFVRVRAGAGENWDGFVRTCLENGWFGLENLIGIPGRVGASPIQNIGAYGVEMEAFVDHLDAVDLNSGEERRFGRRDCGFGYRTSRFKTEPRNRYLITAVTFILSTIPRPCIAYRDLARELAAAADTDPSPAVVAEAVARIRARKLPDPEILGNAGSFFKNPVVGPRAVERLLERFPDMPRYPLPEGRVKVAAGWLIDRCGWKGRRRGRCGVHDRQALVLVNHGGATGADIMALAQEIQESVYSRFGIRLELEPRIV